MNGPLSHPLSSYGTRINAGQISASLERSAITSAHVLLVAFLVAAFAVSLRFTLKSFPSSHALVIKISTGAGMGLSCALLLVAGVVKCQSRAKESALRHALTLQTTFSSEELYHYMVTENQDGHEILKSLNLIGVIDFATYLNRQLQGKTLEQLTEAERGAVVYFKFRVVRVDLPNQKFFWIQDFQPSLTQLLPLATSVATHESPHLSFSFEQLVEWLFSEVNEGKLSPRATKYLESFDKFDLPSLIQKFAKHIQQQDLSHLPAEYHTILNVFAALKSQPTSHFAQYIADQENKREDKYLTLFLVFVKSVQPE